MVKQRYELTGRQVQNLKAIILDANMKGEAARVVVELLDILDRPVVEAAKDDLHSEHKHT